MNFEQERIQREQLIKANIAAMFKGGGYVEKIGTYTSPKGESEKTTPNKEKKFVPKDQHEKFNRNGTYHDKESHEAGLSHAESEFKNPASGNRKWYKEKISYHKKELNKLSSSNKVEKSDEDNLEKGQIDDAMLGYDTKLSFKKKGSDIISHLNTVETEIETELVDLEEKIDTLKEAIVGIEPTQVFDSWIFRNYKAKIKCSYKLFNWNQTYFDTNAKTPTMSEIGAQGAKSDKEAKACSDYNNAVREWGEKRVDLEAIKVLKNNLEPKVTYELNAKQLSALRF